MELQRKSFQVEGFKVLDEQTGLVEAYVSVFGNVDSYNERVMPGAFKVCLEQKLPKGVWMHDWTLPVAKTLVAEEHQPGDPRLPESIRHLGGLYIKGQFNLGTQRGREAFSDVSFGTVDEYSIGYSVVKAQMNNELKTTDLTELKLYEWSPVLVGANPATLTVGVKSSPAKMKYTEHSQTVLATVQEFIERTQNIRDLRAKEGRELSQANCNRLVSISDAMKELANTIDSWLASTAKQPELSVEVKESLKARFNNLGV